MYIISKQKRARLRHMSRRDNLLKLSTEGRMLGRKNSGKNLSGMITDIIGTKEMCRRLGKLEAGSVINLL